MKVTTIIQFLHSPIHYFCHSLIHNLSPYDSSRMTQLNHETQDLHCSHATIGHLLDLTNQIYIILSWYLIIDIRVNPKNNYCRFGFFLKKNDNSLFFFFHFTTVMMKNVKIFKNEFHALAELQRAGPILVVCVKLEVGQRKNNPKNNF